MADRKWSTTPAQGMGAFYHHLHGLSRPLLLHCTPEEASTLAAAAEMQAAIDALQKLDTDLQARGREGLPPEVCKIVYAAKLSAPEPTLLYAVEIFVKHSPGCTVEDIRKHMNELFSLQKFPLMHPDIEPAISYWEAKQRYSQLTAQPTD